MRKIAFSIIAFTALVTGCCSWNYNKKDLEFTQKELNHLGPYKIGDTIYFESNLGDIDTITVLGISEEREEGSRCFISKPPYHNKGITIKHLPVDKWAGTNQVKGGERQITYQSLISISKSPIDSARKTASYSINFKNFSTLENALSNPSKKITINGKTIADCYKITDGYPERVNQPNDVELIYWTDKYGLTAYTSKSGETWIVQNLY